jgi:hypothetical protein
MSRFNALEERQARIREQLINQRAKLDELRSRGAGFPLGEVVSKSIAVMWVVATTTVAVMHFDGKVREGEEMVEAACEELCQAKEMAKKREERKLVQRRRRRHRRRYCRRAAAGWEEELKE